MNTPPPSNARVCVREKQGSKIKSQNEGGGEEIKLLPGYTPLNGKNDSWRTPPPSKKNVENFFLKVA